MQIMKIFEPFGLYPIFSSGHRSGLSQDPAQTAYSPEVPVKGCSNGKAKNRLNTWLIWLEFKSKKLKWASSVTKYVLQVTAGLGLYDWRIYWEYILNLNFDWPIKIYSSSILQSHKPSAAVTSPKTEMMSTLRICSCAVCRVTKFKFLPFRPSRRYTELFR